MIIERLYQGKGIPEGTRPDRIRQVQKVLETRLKNKMHQQYNWFAVATKAVEAGHWGGARRIRARRKLADMIDECRVFLGNWNKKQNNMCFLRFKEGILSRVFGPTDGVFGPTDVLCKNN